MIYFIQEDNERKLIKIGFTDSDVRLRLSQLQTSSPDRLKLIGVMEGNQDTEVEIHTRFVNLNYRAEWFNPGSDLIDFIKQNTTVPHYQRNGNRTRKARLSSEYLNHLEAYKVLANYGMKFNDIKDFLVYYQQNNGPFTRFPSFGIAIKISELDEWIAKQPTFEARTND